VTCKTPVLIMVITHVRMTAARHLLHGESSSKDLYLSKEA
jgi:hypothetical protein